MNQAFVDHLTYALPEQTRTVEETAAAGRTISGAEVLKESGFQQHHICKDGETAYTLANRAVKNIETELSGIGAIVYATCIPINGNVGDLSSYQTSKDVKYLMDYPASRLQADFGLDDAVVFGLNQQACTSMLGSIRLAGMMLASEPEISKVLCVSADRFPEDALYEQSYNLISDGAAACIVSNKPGGFRLLAAHGTTNGAMSFASDDETVGSFFSYSHATISKTLSKAHLNIGQIDWIVPQNTNAKAWMVMSSLLKFDFAKVYFPTIANSAHMISGDNIVNLKHLVDAQRVKSGQRVLLFMAGFGLNWQCVILEKC